MPRPTVRHLRSLAASVSVVVLAGLASARAAAPQPVVTSMIAEVGDRSCDAPPITSADAAQLVRFGLDRVASAAPATLVVTSIRGRAEATVEPAFVTLASTRKGAVSRERDIRRQRSLVKLGPLVEALTRPPTDSCGTDLFGAIRMLRNLDAGGSDGPVAVPLTIVLDSNGFQVETVNVHRWLQSHPRDDARGYGASVAGGPLRQDLRNVVVVFVGLGRLTTQGVDDTTYRRLEQFWVGYVQRCGGQVRFLSTVSALAAAAKGGA
jgi:hypothetical protein